ncbi:hypothetical protein E2493_15145 [Sphingomonas parva]|uniref:Uncharacterized protein n=1 Tax=Sphingomonas parva TaxID=2555898 RepID=A0A4Y8ZN08_9SPHN|nr:hypothetical protein [Sphingomonas parva]TFI57413.1 hypothetical protein E2493_15145 [Sphingomonas parva]
MERRRKSWFAPKRYGYGSGLPVAWQGWAVLAVYLAVVLAAPFLLPVLLQILVIILATAALLLICARTTEGGWRWRSGG